MVKQNKVFALEGRVQHYRWGGFTFLPELLSLPNDQGLPFAEYWLGAHIQAPALIKGNGLLPDFIQEHPETLGEKTAARFGRLPYLLKILDVRDMLSIQVHPDLAGAKAGFEAENRSGIALAASNRNYKDDNHKPELMAALSEFWLLHGFREPASMMRVLEEKAELQFLLPVFDKGHYEALYSRVMQMEEKELCTRLQPLVDRVVPLYKNGLLLRSDPDFWAARAAQGFEQTGKMDRGIFSVYLLNLLKLNKGEAIFQDAGILHAYLEGQNVEIMANSDNVLRGGLTPKHIDVPELLKHVRFEPVVPAVLQAAAINAHEGRYGTPVEDFELREIKLGRDDQYRVQTGSADILFVCEGEILAVAGTEPGLAVKKGESLLLVAGADLRLHSKEGALLYWATVPQGQLKL